MNPSHEPTGSARAQRGAVLVVALLMLVSLTALSVTAVSTGVMEMRMAQNAESRADTFQTAMAAIDFVISDAANLPASGPVGQPSGVALSGSPFTASGGDTITASATRVAECQVPPRMRSATSLSAYSSFQYEIGSDVSRDGSGMGRSAMVQGYLLLGPKC